MGQTPRVRSAAVILSFIAMPFRLWKLHYARDHRLPNPPMTPLEACLTSLREIRSSGETKEFSKLEENSFIQTTLLISQIGERQPDSLIGFAFYLAASVCFANSVRKSCSF